MSEFGGRFVPVASIPSVTQFSVCIRANLIAVLPMKSPELDIDDRQPVWNFMQNFWMDTDPGILLPRVAEVCAASKYSLAELEAIYWNEVRPAVSFNLFMLPAPEWAGFEITWLTNRILKKHRFGKRLPIRWLDPYSRSWWERLASAIISERNKTI